MTHVSNLTFRFPIQQPIISDLCIHTMPKRVLRTPPCFAGMPQVCMFVLSIFSYLLRLCACCPWLILHSLLILAALRVPLAVTWLTVYRQLQMTRSASSASFHSESNTGAGVICRGVGPYLWCESLSSRVRVGLP